MTDRARGDFVIARPSELHRRYDPVPDASTPESRRWSVDITGVRDWAADGLGRSRDWIGSVPRAALAVVRGALENVDRAIPALAIAGFAIIISLALLMIAGALRP